MHVHICVLLCFLLNFSQQAPVYDKTLMKDIQSLTLNRGEFTTGRRTRPINQLICKTGCYLAQPSVVRCENRGTDGKNVQWECKAILPNNVKFGKMTVGCEGYDSSSDPYVLIGSCSLEYNLESTTDEATGTIIEIIVYSIVGLCLILLVVCAILGRNKRSFTGSTSTTYYSSPSNRGYSSRSYSGGGGSSMSTGFASSSNR